MRYFIYGNSGSIYEVQEELKNPKETFGSLMEVFEAIKKKHGDMVDVKGLNVTYHYYDPRIDKEVYVIRTNRYGHDDYIKLYGLPQFIAYLVEV